MAETKIEWAHYTFNPWRGCHKVSAACDNCYAEGWAERYGKKIWGPPGSTEREMAAEAYWKGPVKWNAAAFAAGVRYRVFCLSLGDVFERDVRLDVQRARLFELIEGTPQLDWLLLTKRPELATRLAPDHWADCWPDNVWMGTTVENQAAADKRIPKLMQVPVQIRWLSMEPLLGPVNLYRVMRGPLHVQLDWIVVGGESGGKARPMHYEWLYNILQACWWSDTPALFKQWGEYVPQDAIGRSPTDNVVTSKQWDYVKVGKKKAGRRFQGEEHNGFPTSPAER